jgi:hypothetical protein
MDLCIRTSNYSEVNKHHSLLRKVLHTFGTISLRCRSICKRALEREAAVVLVRKKGQYKGLKCWHERDEVAQSIVGSFEGLLL